MLQQEEKDSLDKFLQCRTRCDIDNQLGQLTKYWKSLESDQNVSSSLSLKQEQENVFVCDNFCNNIELAKQTRDFLLKIAFDKNRKQCNDNDMLPQNSVYTKLIENWKLTASEPKLETDKPASPNEWFWEKYSETIWRATPKTIESFRMSPIFDFLQTVESIWRNSAFPNSDFNKMIKATWVIQRIHQGHGIGYHNDFAPGRQIAFVIFLTPDDWENKDGGFLSVTSNDSIKSYLPKFNSSVIFKMHENKSPMHCVTPVIASNDKPRISLVGFWNS